MYVLDSPFRNPSKREDEMNEFSSRSKITGRLLGMRYKAKVDLTTVELSLMERFAKSTYLPNNNALRVSHGNECGAAQQQ